jgi:hypothetical protein
MFFNPALAEAAHKAVFSQTIFESFKGELTTFTGLVLFSYLLGLVLNAVSELLIDRPANSFFGYHIQQDLRENKVVQAAVARKFGDEILHDFEKRHRPTFTMIESLVGLNLPDAAATAKKFIALAIMFQSLALAMLLTGAAVIRGYVIKKIFLGSWIYLALTLGLILVLVILLLWSYRRYKHMWSRVTLMSFAAWVSPGEGISKES